MPQPSSVGSRGGEDDTLLGEDDTLLNGGSDVSKPPALDKTRKYPLHIEVRLNARSTIRLDTARRIVHSHIKDNMTSLIRDSELEDWRDVPTLAEHVELIRVAESSLRQEVIPLSSAALQIHVYQPALSDDVEEFAAGDTDPAAGDGDDVMAASVTELPSRSLEGVWDSLIFVDDVKTRLLNYIYTTVLFSDANVDFNIVTWNRVVLLHGPPGTGKTSLCRGLAQKLAIRLSSRYSHGKLVEINSHSLFSKWFSESGKLVQRLFSLVTEMVEDEDGFVVILIDEVESLTAARSGAMSGAEPSDALRVVNALLTQLDKLKHRKNVLVMTTSNISQAIDSAFIDRADIKQYIGLPPRQAVYSILQTCLKELMRAGILVTTDILDFRSVELFRHGRLSSEFDKSRKASLKLYDLAGKCHGMSGRTLRRLPVLAHARYIGLAFGIQEGEAEATDMDTWLDAMARTVEDEGAAIERIDDSPSV